MHVPSVTYLIPVLQTAIGPMILISGLGLLLLTMTNRLGRAVDRVRIMANELPPLTDTKHANASAQLHILWRRARIIRLAIALASMSVLAAAIASWAQQAPEHGAHGTPEGWKFSWPAGNPAAGREVFVKLECYACHEVKGEQFRKPDPADEPGKVGPELSGMAPLHPAEYFAEAIINPNAAVEENKGYRATDGSSKMPSYNDLVTVQEVIDLVAYLKGLAAGAGTPAHGTAAPPSGGQMPGH